MKHFVCLLLSLIVLTGCDSGKNTTLNVNPAEVSGKAEGYTGGTGELIIDSGGGEILVRGVINADGTFKYFFPLLRLNS